MDIVYVILPTLVIQAAGLYYESSSETTWYNATRICEIALPGINITDSGNYIDTGYEIKNDKVWVGYFSKTTSFEYIGCTLIDNLSITKTIPKGKNTPGLCYTFCKNKKHLAGISGDKCYCLSKRPNISIREPHCNLICDEHGVACGGDSYISLYKARQDITAPTNEERCYAFQNNGWSGWSECSKGHRSFCIKNNDILDKGFKAWNAYTNLCFSLQGGIVFFKDKETITNASGPSWTNIVSSTAFYTYNDFIPDANSGSEFAYVSRSKNELKFEDGEKKRMRVLCLNETSSSDINGRRNNKKDIAVPVGISVAGVLLTVGGILVCLFIRRRGKHLNFCTKEVPLAKEPESERSQSSRTVKTFDNSSYDQSPEAVHTTTASQEETAVNSDDYMVIEDVDSQPVDEDSTYNTTTATAPRFAEARDINVYNKLELEHNATYDGVHTATLVAKTHDETYNTLTGATYAHTTSPKEKYYTTNEDTYNHMNSSSLKYKKPGSLCDIYGQNT